MKNFIIVLFFVPLFASAQKTHTVKAKETLYSLARQYNVHPRELASYNNIPVETSLSVGQVIKIPAKTTMAPLNVPPTENKEAETKKVEPAKQPEVKKDNTSKTTPADKKETGKPTYHKVAKKETLYHISKLYNVTVDDIRKWNKITGDAVSEGTNLIVGYGKPNTAKQEEPIVKAEEKPVIKEIPKVVEPEKKEGPKPVVKTEQVKKDDTKSSNSNTGAFRVIYEKQVSGKSNVSEQKGNAGVFKSTSGWDDGKYYCLSNSIPAGTIVKISNAANQRAIYAKVLDLIPDLKQNEGMILRISNAAASELGVSGDNFESTINF